MTSSLTKALFGLLSLLVFHSAQGQTPTTDFAGPADVLIQEVACVSLTIWNEGDPGYQPYVRLFVPPEVPINSVAVRFMGDDLNTIVNAGVFSGGTLGDPNLADELPQNDVSGPDGYTFLVINLPVGSMVEDGVDLQVEVCGSLSGPGVTTDVPVEFQAQVVYRYGDSPTGENGPIEGAVNSTSVTPILYRLSKSANFSAQPAGVCWPMEYAVTVDIADGENVTGLTLEDQLPPGLVFDGLMSVTPGCVIQQQPAVGSSGGALTLTCSNANGSDQPTDIAINYLAHFGDVLDPMSCDSVSVINTATLSSNQGPDLATAASGKAYHMTFDPMAEVAEPAPGATVNVGFLFGVSEFVDGIDALEATFELGDGLSYSGNASINGNAVTPLSVTNNGDGTTTLEFELMSALGANLGPCGAGVFFFEAQIEETLNDGSSVKAGETLPISGMARYGIENGTGLCARSFGAAVKIPSVETEKAILSSPANGIAYVPGEDVVYRLTMSIPTEDAQDIVFEDLFPIPIHDVTDLDLTFGNDIQWSPIDNAGLTPQNIYVDPVKNRLFIEWGDLEQASTGSASVISVDITIPIATEPYGNGLIHSNFARFQTSNSTNGTAYSVNLVTLEAGSPDLTFFKGILDTDNPDEVLSPIMTPVNANASGVDAWDWITYQLTMTNLGDAPAYDVIVIDNPDAGLGSCYVETVQDALGNDLSYTGNLFSTGLVIEQINDLSQGNNKGLVTYKCRIQGGAQSRERFENEASASWAASPGNPDRFPEVSDIAQIYVDRPEVTKTIVDINPGYAGTDKAHVGEIVTYQVDVMIPEGYTMEASFEDLLPEGMSFEEIVSIESPTEISFGTGNTAQLLAAAVFSDEGLGEANARRRLTIPLGDIHNSGADNLDKEFFRIVYTASVLNVAENQHAADRNSTARIFYRNPINGAFVNEAGSAPLTIREPQLLTTMTYFDQNLEPGQSTYVTLTVEHAPGSNSPAFNVEIMNDLPLGLEFIENSFIVECDELLAEEPSEYFGTVTARWDSIPAGVTCQLVFNVQVEEAYPPCSNIDNCSSMEWASMFDAHADTLSYTGVNVMAARRTGDVEDAGGVNNDQLVSLCSELEIVSPDAFTPVISGEQHVCVGLDAILQIPEYEGVDVTYYWSGPGVPPGFDAPVLTLEETNETLEGSYSVHVQVGDCFTEESVPFDLVIHDNPVIDVPDMELTCTNGTEDLEIIPEILAGDGPFTYEWTGPDYLSTDPVAVIPNAGADDQGVYTLQVTNPYGCTSNTASSTVEVTSEPPSPFVSPISAQCEGNTVNISCTPYDGDVTYYWITPNGTETTSGALYEIVNASAEDAGLYKVYAQVGECLTDTSQATNVVVNTIPLTPVIEINSNEICEGESLILSTGSVADSYQWSGPNGYSSNLPTPPVILNVDPLSAGTYTLVVSNAGCSSTAANTSVSVVPAPSAPSLSNNGPLCTGATLLIETPVTAEAYRWYFPDGSDLLTTSSNYEIVNATPADAGIYHLAVYNGECWSASSPDEVIVDMVPSEQAFVADEVVACAGQAFSITAGNSESYSGFWSTDEPLLGLISPNSHTTPITGIELGGTYEVQWSLFNEGCGVYSTTDVTITAPEQPVAVTDVYSVNEGEVNDLFVLENDAFFDLMVNLEMLDAPDYGTADLGSNEFVEYRPNDDYQGEDEFIYRMCLNDCPQQCDTAYVKLLVRPFLDVPDIITPNNDGVNDALMITGVENFEQNELYIYNRWGREVYHAVDYQNDWEGEYRGDKLPDGTYFYVFIDRARRETLSQGYITIHQ